DRARGAGDGRPHPRRDRAPPGRSRRTGPTPLPASGAGRPPPCAGWARPLSSNCHLPFFTPVRPQRVGNLSINRKPSFGITASCHGKKEPHTNPKRKRGTV